ncbi:MAG: hypothetical protein EA416_06295, partial [Trueperaceae bacterium]
MRSSLRDGHSAAARPRRVERYGAARSGAPRLPRYSILRAGRARGEPPRAATRRGARPTDRAPPRKCDPSALDRRQLGRQARQRSLRGLSFGSV